MYRNLRTQYFDRETTIDSIAVLHYWIPSQCNWDSIGRATRYPWEKERSNRYSSTVPVGKYVGIDRKHKDCSRWFQQWSVGEEWYHRRSFRQSPTSCHFSLGSKTFLSSADIRPCEQRRTATSNSYTECSEFCLPSVFIMSDWLSNKGKKLLSLIRQVKLMMKERKHYSQRCLS